MKLGLMNIPPEIRDLANYLPGELYVVGGAVRDHIRNVPPLDYDLMWQGVSFHQAANYLSRFGKVKLVCGSQLSDYTFDAAPVLAIDLGGEWVEVALARREISTGDGKKDFVFEVGVHITLYEDSLRRDFTSGAIYYHIKTDTLIDPHDGQKDIEDGVLHIVDPEMFRQSPERVLRGIAQCSRFGWTFSNRTTQVAESMMGMFQYIPVEQVGRHWRKFVLGHYPSQGFAELELTGWIWHLPELDDLSLIEQDPVWHPEGDVFTHTVLVTQQATKIATRENLSDDERYILINAAICHDMGKAVATFTDENGRIKSPGHAAAGIPIVARFLERIDCPPAVSAQIQALTAKHMFPVSEAGNGAVRRLAQFLGNAGTSIRMLAFLMEADAKGIDGVERPRDLDRLLNKAAKLQVIDDQPKPLVMGRHLIELGMKPGKKFGVILDTCFEAQLDGRFDSVTGGMVWAEVEGVI